MYTTNKLGYYGGLNHFWGTDNATMAQLVNVVTPQQMIQPAHPNLDSTGAAVVLGKFATALHYKSPRPQARGNIYWNISGPRAGFPVIFQGLIPDQIAKPISSVEAPSGLSGLAKRLLRGLGML